MAADNERILNGEPVREESKNEVKDVPDNFKEWVRENEDRIERAKVLPMFLRDNKEYSSQRKVDWACVGGEKWARCSRRSRWARLCIWARYESEAWVLQKTDSSATTREVR